MFVVVVNASVKLILSCTIIDTFTSRLNLSISIPFIQWSSNLILCLIRNSIVIVESAKFYYSQCCIMCIMYYVLLSN